MSDREIQFRRTAGNAFSIGIGLMTAGLTMVFGWGGIFIGIGLFLVAGAHADFCAIALKKLWEIDRQ